MIWEHIWEYVTFSNIISVIAIILSAIAVWYTAMKYKVSRKSLELNELKLAPHINISDGYVRFFYKNHKDEKRGKMGMVMMNVDNSGESSANLPKWVWKLTLKNGKTYKGQWKELPVYYEEHPSVYQYPSYMRPYSPIYEVGKRIELQSSKEIEMMDKLSIWVKCKDKREIEWVSYAMFEFKDGLWITKRESRTNKRKK